MNVSVKDKKTGKWYNVLLAGKDKHLVLRLYTFLGLTGSFTALTLMAYFAYASQGRPYSQEIFLAFAVATVIVAKRAYGLWGEATRMLSAHIAEYKKNHPNE